MTHEAIHDAIETRFDANWAQTDVDVRYEEDPRKRPSGKFIRVTVRSLRSREVGYSGNKVLYRRPGFIIMQCFTQVGTGTRVARKMADDAIAIFEGQQFSGVSCNESELRELGQDGKGFWQVNALVHFDFDFERTIN